MARKKKIKKKKNKSTNTIFGFVFGVIGFSLFFLLYISVKHESQAINEEIPRIIKDRNSLKNQLESVKSEVQKLERVERITKIANELFGYVSPDPESLYVVLKEKK